MKRRLIASVMAAMFVVASVPGQTISALAGEQVSVEETYAAGSEGGQADQTQAVAAETASPDNTSEASAAGAAAQVAGDDVSDAMTPELTASDTGVEASLIEDQDSQPSEVVPDDVLSADQSSEGEMPEDGIIEEGSDSAAGDSGLISEDGQEAVSGNMVEERAPEAETKLGEDELINLELNEQVEMTLESEDTRVFTFIPSETGAYRFHSVGATEDAGIYVSISNDLSGTDTIGYGTTDSSTGESQAEGVLKVGIKYYLRAGYYKDNGAPLTVAFQLDQENRFLATAEHQNVKVPFGQQAKLKVNVSGGTDVIYQWLDSDDNFIPNATGSEYRTTEAGNYRCKVTSKEESCYVDFRVSLDTGLEVRSSDGRLGTVSMVVAAGSTPTLAINATTTAMVDSSKFVYSWYRYDVNGGNGLLIRGETKNIYTTDPVNNNVAYSCIVEDGFGNSADIWFNIQVDNAFRATVKGRDESSADMEVKPNESITLEVAADATVKNFTYQWYQTSGQYASIEGANADTYTVENVSKRASYQCEVTDCYGNHEYVNFDVSVDNKLRATVKGSDATYADIEVDLNGNATLEVEADAVEKGFTYQWYQETDDHETLIENANSKAYVAKNVTKSASYRCEVTDFYGSRASVYFNVSVENAFRATVKGRDESSVDMEVKPNESITLEVAADATVKNFTYQWYQETDGHETLIENANSEAYVAKNVTKKASYRCDVTDFYGSRASVYFDVSVDNAFRATVKGRDESFADMEVKPNESITLEVAADATVKNFTYQWYQETDVHETLIENANSKAYVAKNVTKSASYRCEVTDFYGNWASVYFNVSVENAFRATVKGRDESSVDMEVKPNESITLEVAADATVKNFTYQWYQETDDQETLIENANSEAYVAKNVTKSALYRCDVTDVYGNRASVHFNVSVENAFRATVKGRDESSVDMEVKPNESITLEVAADATVKNFTYQWYQETDDQETLIENANSEAYVAKNVTKNASYLCEVIDVYGNRAYVYFNVSVENAFRATVKGRDESSADMEVKPNESITLEVAADATVKDFTYQWYQTTDDQETLIENANSEAYVAKNVTKYASYRCDVTDVYGSRASVYFDVSVENAFRATVKGRDESSADMEVKLNESITLEVAADATVKDFTYQWYQITDGQETLIENANSEAYVAKNVTKYALYRCDVTDFYGNRAPVFFYVSVENAFRATVKGRDESSADMEVKLNESITLEVAADATVKDFTYQWYQITDGQETLIENANSEAYVAKNVTKYALYRCDVTDFYGNWAPVFFNVSVENAFRATVKGRDESSVDMEVKPNESIMLEVAADATVKNFTYQWYQTTDDQETLIENANSEAYVAKNVTKNASYRCDVTDVYGSRASVYFNVSVEKCDHTHTWRKLSEKPATCTEAGEKTEICDCGEKRTTSIQALGHVEEKIPAVAATCTKTGLTEGTKCSRCGVILRAQQSTPVLGHSYGAWVQVKAPTALEEGYRERTCTRCGAKDPGRQMIAKLPATMTLNATSIPLQVKKSTTKLTVSGLAAGDSVASVASSNTKIVKASWNGRVLKITAQKKTGKAKVTIALRSGLSRTVTVKVQKPKVVSRKITGVPSKLTLKKGQKYKLTPGIQPITAPDKIKYSSSNKKTAKVSSKGLITAGKKPGKATITISAGGKKFKVKVTVPKK